MHNSQLTFNAGWIVNSPELPESFKVIFEVHRAAAVAMDDTIRKKGGSGNKINKNYITIRAAFSQRAQNYQMAPVKWHVASEAQDHKGRTFSRCHHRKTTCKSQYDVSMEEDRWHFLSLKGKSVHLQILQKTVNSFMSSIVGWCLTVVINVRQYEYIRNYVC